MGSTSEQFARYHQSVASRLRYAQAQHNLQEMHELEGSLRVLDAAGGNGLNTQHLLEKGHEVTLLDSDPEMLDQARQRLGQLGLLEACRLVEGRLEEITKLLPAEQFDLILCHHVVEYTDDVPKILKSFSGVAGRSGELSLVTLNPVSEVIRAVVFRRDPSLAESKLTDLSYDAKWFGAARLLSLDQIETWSSENGWSIRDFRGIRILADYIGQEAADSREQDLLRLETRLAGLEPYRRFGRYLQFCMGRTDRAGG